MNRTLPKALALWMLAGPAAARANVIWSGDFETGDLSQWSKAQVIAPDRATVVSSPVTEGRYALRVVVRQGDDPIGASGNRNELAYLSYEAPGTERWYRWQTMWDAKYPKIDAWQLFTQWHHSGPDGSPPVEFYVYGEEIRLRVGASDIVWTAPLVRGAWHDFVFHVKWSPSASDGFVELWFDGKLVLPKKAVATQYPGQTNYLKQGLYRAATVAPDGVVFHDGFTIGETRADVWPDPAPAPSAAPAAPPAPAPAAAPPPAPAAPPAPAPKAEPILTVFTPGQPPATNTVSATAPAPAAATSTPTPAKAVAPGSAVPGPATPSVPAPEPAGGCSTGGSRPLTSIAALGLVLYALFVLGRRTKGVGGRGLIARRQPAASPPADKRAYPKGPSPS